MSIRISSTAGRTFAAILLGGAWSASADASALATIDGVAKVSRIGGIGPGGSLVGGGQIGSDPASPSHAFLSSRGTTTDLGTLGGSTSSAGAVNTAGQVVGESYTANDAEKHAFLYAGGRMADLGTLGGSASTATAINAQGQVVGQSTTATGDTHAFSLTGSKMTDLGTLGGTSSSAAGINDAGQIIGQSALPGGLTHAFLLSGGKMNDLGTLGGSSSFGYGINGSGAAVGQAYTAGDASAHAVLWSNGTTTDLGVLPGFHASIARAINDSGQIVGNSYGMIDPVSKAFVQHAFLYDNGLMKDLNSMIPPNSGWVLSEASSIGPTGLISGFGLLNGQREAYTLAFPASQTVPEPTVLAMAGVILAGLGVRAARRARV